MNPYSNSRYPLLRSVSSPTPTNQMAGAAALGVGGGGAGGGGAGGGGGGGGGGMGPGMDVNMSREQISNMMSSTTSSTPPPPPAANSSSGNSNTPATANSMAMMGGAAAVGAATVTGGGGGSNANSSTLATSMAGSTGNRNSAGAGTTSAQSSVNREQVYTWIQELSSPETREHALIELSRKREVLPDLAPLLWHSFGTIAALLQEIVTIYPVINPPTLNAQQSNRVCNALALLQCVASHPETRSAFLNAHIPLFLYPFLHTVSKSRPFEYLRLTSLGVVGALVKTDEQDVINFLLTTEIIPLCLRIMESGSELSKTVATFILQKILLDETGLSYICQTFERFSHVANVLDKMVMQLGKEPSTRLLKHVVRCYLRLSDNLRAREALRQCLPEQLKDSTFAITLKDDSTTKKWLSQLLQNLSQGIETQMAAAVGTGANSSGGVGAAATTAATSQ